MYNKLKDMYHRGLLDAEGIRKAVTKGWITAEQAEEIIASK